MAECYICNHEITAICARCGAELVIRDEQQVEAGREGGTEIRVEPCDCDNTPQPTKGKHL